MKRLLNVVQVCLVTSLLVIPAFNLFNAGCLADDVRLKDKHPPSWYQILPAEKRFVLVMNDEAVLDKETGLVWERTPSTIRTVWNVAIDIAYDKTIGGRKGWRPPTIEELGSLVDTTQYNPALPIGHPFIGINSTTYWSSTSYFNFGTEQYAFRTVAFSDGHITGGTEQSALLGIWCVRGGHGRHGFKE